MFDKPIVCIDFDGTLYLNGFPDIDKGSFAKNAINSVKKIKDSGWYVILWTCREGKYLEDAINVCNRVLIEFDCINENVANQEVIDKMGFCDCRKVFADIYIDDKNLYHVLNNKPFDWLKIADDLVSLYRG